MEKALTIPVSHGHRLYGKFSGSLRQPLFIIVHGLPGHMREQLPVSSVMWFAKQGFATFRFDLYGWRKGARQLIDCTLRMHADDLDSVVRYFRKRGVKKIFVAGHSYGGAAPIFFKKKEF